jgi:hypothetical protein
MFLGGSSETLKLHYLVQQLIYFNCESATLARTDIIKSKIKTGNQDFVTAKSPPNKKTETYK